MKRILPLILFIFLLANLSAICEKGQIDINFASISELDELYGIGEVKAQAIIDSRPYDSVDDLVNAYGIGEATLEKIKDQGLACVEDEEEPEEESKTDKESEEKDSEEENEDEEERVIDSKYYEEIVEETKENKMIVNEVIELNPKVIKTEDNSEELTQKNYAVYGLICFCVFLVGLYGIKFVKNKKYQKNEFG